MSQTQAADTIMIVDDNPTNLSLLADLLQSEGYQVRPVTQGRQAVDLARRQHDSIDLILLDILMPDLDGYQVCEELKADPATRDIPVIFISALNEQLDKVRAFEIGGVDYVGKPFQTPEVLARVGTHLQLYALRKNLAKLVDERTTALRETNAALQKALEVKNEFLMIMQHEFHTPLNAILGATNLLAKPDVPEADRRGFLRLLESGSWRLLHLIDNLLTMTSIGMDDANLEQEAESCDVAALCNECLASIKPRLQKKNLTLESEIPVELKLSFPMGISRLRQVLLNLLDNAIKFTPPGGSIGLEAATSGTYLICRVWDSGIGISENEQNKIFEPFTQLHGRGLSRTYEGVGLGLTVAANLVKLHNGRITVYSRKEGGSVFEVTIPFLEIYQI